jgi:DNA polymerase III delta prime subunit
LTVCSSFNLEMDDDDFGDVAFNPDAAIDDYDEYQQQIEEYIPEDTVIDEVSKSLHSEFASSSSSSSSANDTNSSSSSISVIQSKEIESREALSSVLSLPPAFLRKKNTDEVAQIFAMKLLAERKKQLLVESTKPIRKVSSKDDNDSGGSGNEATVYLLERPDDSCFDITVGENRYFVPMRQTPLSSSSSSSSSLFESVIPSVTDFVAPVVPHLVELENMATSRAKAISTAAKAAIAAVDIPTSASSAKAKADDNDDDDAMNDDDDGASSATMYGSNNGKIDNELWVDKYAPKHFIDLISPENVNREVLRWIKMWDNKVFGGKSSASNSSSSPTFNSGNAVRAPHGGFAYSGSSSGTAAHTGGGGGGGGGRFSNFLREQSPVLVLAGPPGTGKTTLAKVIASHAGYRTEEVNASDDRTGAEIREKIKTAQSVQSSFSDKRPVCLILDEVDGMDGGPTGGVAELVKIIKATNAAKNKKRGGGGGGGGGGWGSSSSSSAIAAKGNNDPDGGDEDDADASEGDDEMKFESVSSTSLSKKTSAIKQTISKSSGALSRKRRRGGEDGGDENEDGEGGGKGGKGNKSISSSVLTRPLLCICNDIYTPQLRELRKLVHVVEVGAAPSERLAGRLKEICSSEGLLVSPDALSALARVTDGDIRSCLNTLQFLSAQTGGRKRSRGKTVSSEPRLRVTPEMIQKAAVGCKDESKALFDVWSNVYSSSAMRSSLSSMRLHSTDIKDSLGLLWQQSSGHSSDSRTLLSGLHENLLQDTKGAGPALEDAVIALDYICSAEEMSQKVMSTQQHSLLKYIPASAVGVHLSCAKDGVRFRPSWPRADAAARRKHDQRSSILQSFMHGRASAPGAKIVSCSGVLDARNTSLDMISPLLSILNPPLRSINATLLTTKEQKDVASLVELLCGLGLELSQAPSLSQVGFFNASATAAVGSSSSFNSKVGRKGGAGFADTSNTSSSSSSSASSSTPSFRFLPFGGAQIVLNPHIELLASFEDPIEGSYPFDNSLRGPAISDTMKESIAHQVRLLKLKLSKSSRNNNESDLPLPDEVVKRKALPEHIRRQLIVPSATEGGLDSAFVTETAEVIDSRPKEQTFLAEAAAKSRETLIARKRSEIGKETAKRDVIVSNASFAASTAGKAMLDQSAAVQHEAEKQRAEDGAAITASRALYKVTFRYHEGHSIAVKRHVQIGDFLR